MKKEAILVFILSCSNFLFSQKYFGLNQSGYGGTQTMQYNPAKVLNNLNKANFEFFSVNAYANSNTFKINKDSLKKGFLNYNNKDGDFKLSTIAPILEVRLPSFCYKVKDNFAFGISTRVRYFNQFKNANATIFNFYNNQNLLDTAIIQNENGFNYKVNAISDIGITGSVKVYDNKIYRITGGISFRKYYGAGFFNLNNIALNAKYYAFPNSILNVNDLNLQLYTSAYDYQKVIDDFNDPRKAMKNLFMGETPGKGNGFDIGGELIYNKDGQMPTFSEKIEKIDTKPKPYNFKLGISLLDVGKLTYNGIKVLKITGNGYLRSDSVNKYLSDFNSIKKYFKQQNFNTDSTTIDGLKINLPTTLNLYVDYCVTNKIFVTFAILQNLIKSNSPSPFYTSQFTIVPRYETKHFDFAVPITLNSFSNDIKFGAAFRVGPISLGSDDVALLFKNSKGGNIYASLNVAINKKEKITVLKKIINKITDNNSTKSAIKMSDIDGDGIIDINDECVSIAGLKEFNGLSRYRW